jgi:hypothetical protein
MPAALQVGLVESTMPPMSYLVGLAPVSRLGANLLRPLVRPTSWLICPVQRRE